jgi:hypothetical protein
MSHSKEVQKHYALSFLYFFLKAKNFLKKYDKPIDKVGNVCYYTPNLIKSSGGKHDEDVFNALYDVYLRIRFFCRAFR